MAGDSTKKVVSGQPLRISAATWNDFIDAADYVKNQDNRSGSVSGFNRDLNKIRILNRTGQNLDRGAVVKLGESAVGYEGEEANFALMPVLLGETIDSTANDFAILLEPAGPEQVVRAAVNGTVFAPCTDATQAYADISAGSYSLHGGSSGPVKILYGSDGWALVRFQPEVSESPPGTFGVYFGEIGDPYALRAYIGIDTSGGMHVESYSPGIGDPAYQVKVTLPYASASVAGTVSTGTQTLAGEKTFQDDTYFPSEVHFTNVASGESWFKMGTYFEAAPNLSDMQIRSKYNYPPFYTIYYTLGYDIPVLTVHGPYSPEASKPRFAVNDGFQHDGVWGTLADGTVVCGGIITQIGSGGTSGTSSGTSGGGGEYCSYCDWAAWHFTYSGCNNNYVCSECSTLNVLTNLTWNNSCSWKSANLTLCGEVHYWYMEWSGSYVQILLMRDSDQSPRVIYQLNSPSCPLDTVTGLTLTKISGEWDCAWPNSLTLYAGLG